MIIYAWRAIGTAMRRFRLEIGYFYLTQSQKRHIAVLDAVHRLQPAAALPSGQPSAASNRLLHLLKTLT